MDIRKDLPVTEDWEEYDKAVCRQCNTLARVHPDTVGIWGCLKCGYSTAALYTFFRMIRLNSEEPK